MMFVTMKKMRMMKAASERDLGAALGGFTLIVLVHSLPALQFGFDTF